MKLEIEFILDHHVGPMALLVMTGGGGLLLMTDKELRMTRSGEKITTFSLPLSLSLSFVLCFLFSSTWFFGLHIAYGIIVFGCRHGGTCRG